MPEYLSVEVYSPSPGETLTPFLDDVRQLLEMLGYTGTDVSPWLAQIVWEPDGSGFGSSLEPAAALEKVVVNGRALLVKPIVHGWTQESIPQLREAWVSLELACETQTSRQNLDSVSSFSATYARDHRFLPGVGKAIWSIMRQCAALFPHALVYFTNEAQTGEAWQALVTGQVDQEERRKFEAALLPQTYAARFVPFLDQMSHIHFPEGIGLAYVPSWTVLPWDE